jgi:hypothetical protein
LAAAKVIDPDIEKRLVGIGLIVNSTERAAHQLQRYGDPTAPDFPPFADNCRKPAGFIATPVKLQKMLVKPLMPVQTLHRPLVGERGPSPKAIVEQ